MTISIACPSCRKQYNLGDNLRGKTVLCRECRSPIAVPALAAKGRGEGPSRPPDDRIAASARSASAAGRASRDEDDNPRSRPAGRPSPRKDKAPQGGSNLVPILIGAGVAAFLLVGLVIGGVVLFIVARSGSNDQAVVTSNDSSSVAPVGMFDPAPVTPVATPPAAPPVTPPAAPVAEPPAGPAREDKANIPAGPVPADMATDDVKKVKQSTVYLRVTLPGGDIAQGSGFFAFERGIVITNAHVVGMLQSDNPPRGVDVVMHSGEPDEAKLSGTLLGLDRENDLAVLRVQGDPSRLPPPLPIASAAQLMETQNVYIFGFPFGAQLGKNITVSKSAISALRKDKGVLKQVQVNGGMSPGNSGGPVTDARGAVVGVSVAVIKGTQINFAVPADFIEPLVERSKKTPLDLTPRPGPLARNDPPGPAPRVAPEGDLAALKGTWQSGSVNADGGGAAGTLKLNIIPQGGQGGRIRIDVATKQGGRTTSSTLNYGFTLEQKGGQRLLVTNIRGGKGAVFLYRLEGDQLLLSGVVATRRLAYTLKNVALRHTSAEPEMPADGNPGAPAPGTPVPAPGMPVAGEKGRGSPDALKFSGDVYAFVEEAARDKRLVDVDIRGFTVNTATYRDVFEKGGVLIGLQVGLGKFINNDVVKSWRPIFLTKSGIKPGRWQGPVPPAPVTLKAKNGYVVSGISVRTGLGIDALRLTYAKLGTEGLDLSDTYSSDWVGGNGGRPAEIGGKGALYVGVTGHLGNDGSPSSLGLVAVLPKE